MSYVQRFFDHPAGSYFLFGPRGTGKSTWLRARYPDAAWIDLLDTAAERHYYTRPERLKEFISAHAGRRTIVIDEIQRVPQLLPLVHQHLETDKSIRFVLTGSSARKLRRSGVDLLAGRAVRCAMHPFMAAELGSAFDLARSLESGLVPLVVMAEDPDRTLRGYIDLYLQQEVKAEGLVRRLDDFSRFLEVASFSHAQLLNVADIARECVASRNTVESYLGILEDLLIATRLPVFRRRAKRAVVAHAKLYFFDSGVFRSLRPVGPLDAREEIAGPALEGLVLQHLRAWISYGDADCRIHFWRTRGGSEVDFVLYGGAGFYAIEVKNSRSLRPSHLRGLRTFHQDYPESSPLLLYRGDEALERNGVRCLPVARFLRELIPGRDLPC
ncbi:MAG: ATP-binding protein [Acidobacteria bacterium]|nr:ATP-binding protein [Acidobacteriota bacterium]